MKKFFAVAMMFAVGIALSITACSSTGLEHTVEGKKYITEGWVDDDTFQLEAAGAPTKTLTNKVQRKESAKRGAAHNFDAIDGSNAGSPGEGGGDTEDCNVVSIRDQSLGVLLDDGFDAANCRRIELVDLQDLHLQKPAIRRVAISRREERREKHGGEPEKASRGTTSERMEAESPGF